MNVFVTGSSSHLAQALLPILCAEPAIDRVTGVDLAPPRFFHAKFHATRLDIRDRGLPSTIEGHDALVHLAFVVLRGRMSESDMFDVNVTGSHKLFHAPRRGASGAGICVAILGLGRGTGVDRRAHPDAAAQLPACGGRIGLEEPARRCRSAGCNLAPGAFSRLP